MATIKKRGDTFQITVSLGYDEMGKQRRKTLTFKPPKNTPEKKAQKLAEQAGYDFELKCKGLHAFNENMTLNALCDWYFENVAPNTIRPSTMNTYLKSMETYILPEIGFMKLKDISPARLDILFSDLRKSGRKTFYYVLTDKAVNAFAEGRGRKAAKEIGIAYSAFVRILRGVPATKFNAEIIAKFFGKTLNSMFKPTQNDTGLKAVTVDRIYGNLRTIFNSAVRVGIMKENPLKRCTPLKISKFDTEKKALDTQQAKSFLELLEDEQNSNLKCAMFVGLFCGLRSGEIRALHWDDIDLEKELIYVRHSLYKESYGEHHLTSPKTKSSYRTLKIPQAVVDLIKNHKAWQDDYIAKMGSEYENSGIVFTNAHGGYLHSQYLNDNFKKILKKGNFPEGLHYHNLRHSCASLLIYNGVNATTVARQLGHSDTTTTLRIYTHAFDDAQAAAAQALETILIDKNSDENK